MQAICNSDASHLRARCACGRCMWQEEKEVRGLYCLEVAFPSIPSGMPIFVRSLLRIPSLTERGIVTKSCPKRKQTRTALLYDCVQNRTMLQAQTQVRQAFSTSAGRSSRPWTWAAAALLAFSGASGFVGYQLALKRNITAKSGFGSKQDYEYAIRDLRALFPGDAASTDPDDLLAHGFSLNDHHPGASGNRQLSLS